LLKLVKIIIIIFFLEIAKTHHRNNLFVSNKTQLGVHPPKNTIYIIYTKLSRVSNIKKFSYFSTVLSSTPDKNTILKNIFIYMLKIQCMVLYYIMFINCETLNKLYFYLTQNPDTKQYSKKKKIHTYKKVFNFNNK